MSADIKFVVDETSTFTIATSSVFAGKVAILTALFGTDGVNVGSDSNGDALSYPITMDEGADGVFHGFSAPESGRPCDFYAEVLVRLRR